MVAQDRRYEESRFRDDWEDMRRERGRDDRDDEMRRYRSERRDYYNPTDYGRGRESAPRDEYARFGESFEHRPDHRRNAAYGDWETRGSFGDFDADSRFNRNQGGFGRSSALESRERDAGQGNLAYGNPSYGQYGRYLYPSRDHSLRDWGQRDWGNRNRDERPFWDRASDEVSSWFGDDEAARRREADQYRGRGPKNYVRSDERIREDICDRLAEDPSVDASEIEVSVSKAEVSLNGFVAARAQKHRAEENAERVYGVSHVQNNLRVRQPESAPQTGNASSQGSIASASQKATATR